MMLWVTTWFPDANHPVRGTFIDAHWKAFKARQPSCRLLFVDVSPASRCLTINLKDQGDGLLVLEIRSVFWQWLLHMPALLARLVAQSYTRQGYDQPTSLHGHVVYPAGSLTRHLADRWSCPYWITEHWSKATTASTHWFKGPSIRSTYAKARAIFPVSEHLANDLRVTLENLAPITVIPNVVNLEAFTHEKRHRQAQAAEVNLLTVASLIEANKHIKRIDLLIEALAILNQRHPSVQWHLHHVGAGDRLQALQALANSRSVQVTWHGALEAEALALRYRQSDILLQASLTETFGIVVLEALASGLPVIASDIPAFQNWIHAGTGLLTPLTAEGFADAVEQLWQQPIAVANDALDFSAFDASSVSQALMAAYSQ